MFQFAGFPPRAYVFGPRRRGCSPAGFPHSDTHGSLPVCGSPWLFAACRVLRRLPVPRHPPCAFLCLTLPFARLAWRLRAPLPYKGDAPVPSGTAARTLPRMCAHPCAPCPSCSRVFHDSCIADRWYRICYGLGFRYSVFKVQVMSGCLTDFYQSSESKIFFTL